MYRIILIAFVYYQLLRDAQAQRLAVQNDLDEFRSWYRNEKKPQFFSLQATIDDLEKTNQNLTKEKVNRTPNNNNNNNNVNNINNYVNNINNYIIVINL